MPEETLLRILRPGPTITVNLYIAAVHLHQMFHDGKSQTQTSMNSRSRPVGLPKQSKINGRNSGLIPIPVSVADRRTLAGIRFASIRTIPDSGVNFTALLNRFQKTCCNGSRRPSPQHQVQSSFSAGSFGFERWSHRFDGALNYRAQINCARLNR